MSDAPTLDYLEERARRISRARTILAYYQAGRAPTAAEFKQALDDADAVPLDFKTPAERPLEIPIETSRATSLVPLLQLIRDVIVMTQRLKNHCEPDPPMTEEEARQVARDIMRMIGEPMTEALARAGFTPDDPALDALMPAVAPAPHWLH